MVGTRAGRRHAARWLPRRMYELTGRPVSPVLPGETMLA